jgi:hypothetical protein
MMIVLGAASIMTPASTNQPSASHHVINHVPGRSVAVACHAGAIRRDRPERHAFATVRLTSGRAT